LKGNRGAVGLNGVPASAEQFKYPTKLTNEFFQLFTVVNTPINEPISIRVFENSSLVFEILFYVGGGFEVVDGGSADKIKLKNLGPITLKEINVVKDTLEAENILSSLNEGRKPGASKPCDS
jgi:hypothetical protein